MAASTEPKAGVKGVVSKVKGFVVDLFSPVQEEDLYSDGEVLETDVTDEETPAVFMSEKSEAADNVRKEPEKREEIFAEEKQEKKAEEPFSFSGGHLYAYSNDYTGSKSYEDNQRVAFSVGGDDGFGSREPAVPAASSVIFSNPSTKIDTTPSTSTVAASAGDDTAGDRTSNEVDFAYSGGKSPATFGSRPSTRYDAPVPSYRSGNTVTGDGTGTVKARAVVGFNTNSATSGGSSAAAGYNGQKTNKYGGTTMDNTTVQILRPRDISEAMAAGMLIKKGIVVICNLSEIPDKNVRIRFSDFLCGCCKGCDADFSEIISVESPNAVLIAAPAGVNLKNPAEPVKQEEKKPASANIDIGGADFNDIFSYTPGADPKAGSMFDMTF